MATEDGLAVVLSEFARTLVTDFSLEGILDHLVRRIVDILPVDAAGVSLISPDQHPLLVAGSDESAVRYEQLQTTLGEGPCLAAYRTDTPILIPDLHGDDRFPRFAKGALEEGLVAVFTFPLRNDDRCLGALDLYRTTSGALDETDVATAQTLADVATAYLLNAEARLAKNDFIATVSHELRTPMTSIVGYVELLRESTSEAMSLQHARCLDAIERNSRRLGVLADDLLRVSDLESEAPDNVRVDLDIADVVRAAREMLLPAVAIRGLSVTFELPEDPVLVRGNAADLESMVVNLLTNAMKFTADGGWVTCRLRVFAATARIEVSDNGLGIPIAEQRNLFKRFFRSSTAQLHAIQGSGLGLTIVDLIVHKHGGDVSVVSDHLMGSTFTVDLPLIGSVRVPVAL